MSIQGAQSADESVGARWQDDDPVIRLQAVHSIGKSGAQGQPLLAQIAAEDSNGEVRAAAVAYLTDIALLDALRQKSGSIQDAAVLQYHRLLAGCIPSSLGPEEQLDRIQKLDEKAAKQVALLAKSKAAGVAALSRLTESQDFSDIALFAASIHVRKAAVLRLSDPDLIEDLLKRLGEKDKSIALALAQRLAKISPAANSTSASDDPVAAPATTAVVDDTEIAPTADAAVSNAPEVEEAFELVTARAEALTETIRALAQELTGLGHRNTPRLNDMVNAQRNLVLQIKWPKLRQPEGIFAELKAMQPRINELLELNRKHQQELAATAPELLNNLTQSLEAGQSAEAIQAWDKLQGLLGNLGGKLAKELRKQLQEHRARISELKDWKNFAGTEKKKELIKHMQHLQESKMSPADRARQINALHLEWKSLGRTAQNEKLWREFKTISDAVYEPCKEYFRQQKQLMAGNFKQRNEICNQLEAYLQQLDRNNVIITDLTKIEEQANADWKRFAPVEQSKIKKLQKRFYGLMDELRGLRRDSQSRNTQQKQALMERAQQLAELEDHRQAMNEAKALQAQWKLIGPGSFREDRKLWEGFRAACDRIFQKREEQQRETKDAAGKSVAEARRVLSALDALHALEDEAFRESRKQFTDLQREFREALDTRVKKERQQLLDQFNDAVRKIDARFKRLPDRKVAQLRSSLAQRADFCSQLENNLLACADDNAVRELLSHLDAAQWDSLPLSGNAEYDTAIENRYRALKQASSLEAIRKLAVNCLDEARNLCVSLEIRANVNSPADDQALRMQLQLSQLQAGFGKGLHSSEDNLKFARDTELRFLCLGPLESAKRQSLAQRLTRAAERIG